MSFEFSVLFDVGNFIQYYTFKFSERLPVNNQRQELIDFTCSFSTHLEFIFWNLYGQKQ